MIDKTNKKELARRQLELVCLWKRRTERRRARPNDSCKADYLTLGNW